MGFASVLVNWMTRNCQYLRFYLWSIDFLQRMNSLIGSLVVGSRGLYSSESVNLSI